MAAISFPVPFLPSFFNCSGNNNLNCKCLLLVCNGNPLLNVHCWYCIMKWQQHLCVNICRHTNHRETIPTLYNKIQFWSLKKSYIYSNLYLFQTILILIYTMYISLHYITGITNYFQVPIAALTLLHNNINCSTMLLAQDEVSIV